MPHFTSFFTTRKLHSKARPVLVRSVSDAAVLATAFITGMALCWNAAVANAFYSRLAGRAAGLFVGFNQFLMLVVIFLLWKLLRWGRERNELYRERNKITGELNHAIRNACQAILISTYTDKGGDPVVRDSVFQIDRALKECIPFLTAPPGSAQNRPHRNRFSSN